jgi:hypothetical protein
VTHRSCSAWHPIFCRMRLDHPFDHPDDPSPSVWSRLDRPAIQRKQARSVWSRPDRRRDPSRNRKVEGSNPSSGSKTAAQEVFSGVAGRAAATAGSFLGLDHRARRRAAPASLRWSPSDRSNARRGPGSSAHSGRHRGGRDDSTGPADRARIRASPKTRLRLRRPSDSAPSVMPSGIGWSGGV